MGGFAEATQLHQDGQALFAILDAEWSHGAPLGGYLAAIAVRAAGRFAQYGHRPVSASCQFLSRPVFGRAEVEVEVRKPGSASCINVSLVQGGRRFLQAQVWTTSRDMGPSTAEAPIPSVPAVGDLKPLESMPEIALHIAPRFWRNFEVRPVTLLNPPEARVRQWIRVRGSEAHQDTFLSAGCALLFADVLPWNAHLRRLCNQVDYMGVTLDTASWFHSPAPAGAWQLCEAYLDTAANGLLYGGMRLWGDDGHLIATGATHMISVSAAG